MAAQLTIIVPDLIDALLKADPEHSTVHSLCSQLARAQRSPSQLAADQAHDQDAYFCSALQCMGIEHDSDGSLPPASVSAAADLDGSFEAGILRADPVYLQADVSRLVLHDAGAIGLTDTEADRLIELLNQSFTSEGLIFQRGAAATRWYVSGATAPSGATYSPRDLNGRVLEPTLAASQGLGALKRIMTEAQMLLYECEANAERAARGLPPVNSIWIWGGGQLQAPAVAAERYLFSDDDELLAAARHCQIAASSELGQLSEHRYQADVAVVVACAPGTMAVELEQFATRLLKPALAQLRRGELSGLSLLTAHANFEFTPRSRFRWWRRAAGLLLDFEAMTHTGGRL